MYEGGGYVYLRLGQVGRSVWRERQCCRCPCRSSGSRRSKVDGGDSIVVGRWKRNLWWLVSYGGWLFVGREVEGGRKAIVLCEKKCHCVGC